MSRRQKIQSRVTDMVNTRLAVSKRKYPTNIQLQYLDTVGYLIGILSEMAESDSLVLDQLMRIIKRKEGE